MIKPFPKFSIFYISGPKDVIIARQELTQKYNEEIHELERELDKNVCIITWYASLFVVTASLFVITLFK